MRQRRTATQRDYDERILRVLIRIQQDLDQALDLDQLASVACFSPFHFHRVFCAMVGEPVKGHVRRLRLERAALRLKQGKDSVIQVALHAGYETPESFSRAFRKRFGCAPRDYRQAQSVIAPSGVYYSPDGTVEQFHPLSMEQLVNPRIETMDGTWVAFVRHTGPYDQVGSAWQKIFGWVGRRGLLGPRTRSFGLAHDDPDVTPGGRLRYDACVSVPDGTAPDGDVGVQYVEGGRYAAATHVGPYAKLGATYGQLLAQWMPTEDLEPAVGQPFVEIYRNNPQDTPEEELKTDVHVPVCTRP